MVMPLIGRHISRTLQLAVPIAIARICVLGILLSDVVMAAHVSVEDLGSISVALSFHGLLYSFAVGLLLAISTLTAQAHGAGKPSECHAVWILGIQASFLMGIASVAILFNAEALLTLFGQKDIIVEIGGPVLRMLSLGLLADFVFLATSFYLEGVEKPRAAMIMVAIAFACNIGLNSILMFGPFHMGAFGAVLATVIVEWALCISILVYVLLYREQRVRWTELRNLVDARRRLLFWRIGYPTALALLVERGLFFSLIIFAGWIGVNALAALEICTSVLSIIYMITSGIAGSTKVRVGNALGRNRPDEAVVAGWVGVLVCSAIMIALSPLLVSFGEEIVRFYVDDQSVIALAVPALAVSAIIIVLDGAQGTMAGALQGVAAVRFVLFGYACGTWLIGAPVAWWFGYHLDGGITGMMYGLIAGFLTVLLLFVWRFHVLSCSSLRPVV